MGYYSEIGLCLNKTAHDKMLAELATQNEQTQAEVRELLNDAEKYVTYKENEEESLLYHWTWRKWYSTYNDVIFIENFLGNLPDDESENMLYRFVRIGEEYDDIEVLGTYYDNPFEMDLGRGVHINAQHSPIKKIQAAENVTQ